MIRLSFIVNAITADASTYMVLALSFRNIPVSSPQWLSYIVFVTHRNINWSHIYELFEAEWRIYASVKYAIISSDNGLAPNGWQAIIWTSADILLIEPLGTNFI